MEKRGMMTRVDSITQAALGAAVGEAMLGRRLGNRALAWGAFFGTLPDLDVLFMPLLGNAADLWWHRGPSHSLLMMVLASWGISRWLAVLWKKEKISRKQAGWFIFAAWSTHVLIDCFTVYGTSVWWPLPLPRVAFNQLFIVDPLFTLPMVVTLVWLATLRKKKELAKRRRLNAWGLGLASGYALLALGMKFLVSGGFDADLARRGVAIQRRMEAPTPFNIVLWRSVVEREDEFWVGYRSVFEGKSAPVRWTVYPKEKAALQGLEGESEVRTLTWFAGGWYLARRHARGVWIGDLRFGESRVWGARKGMVDSRMAFSWDVLLDAPGDRVRAWGPGSKGGGETFKRMGLRVLGYQDAWEAYPRLAGVTGRMPEVLSAME